MPKYQRIDVILIFNNIKQFNFLLQCGIVRNIPQYCRIALQCRNWESNTL